MRIRFSRYLATLLVSVALVAFVGCGTLMPKKVELFQDKVEKVPVQSARENETLREAAKAAEQTAQQTLVAATREDASTNVLNPAADTAVLTRAVSTAVGPPAQPWKGDFQVLAAKLDATVAALDRRLESFREDNDQNRGKKIEGTGVFQVPYFVWLGGAFVLVIFGFIALSVVWMIVKTMAVANPIASLGIRAVELGGQTAARGLSQLVKGGENFKDAVKKSFPEDLAAKVVEMFTTHQKIEQDGDIKVAVKHLTN